MIISKEALQRIREIIAKHYTQLISETNGLSALTEQEINEIRNITGETPENYDSLLSLLYYNNILNDVNSSKGPSTVPQMRQQQQNKPSKFVYKAGEEHINENFKHVVEKFKADIASRFEGVIRDMNNDFRNNVLQNGNRPEELQQLVKESTTGKLKQRLRDLTGDLNRNWERVAVTETANAIGMGSLDRVVSDNEGKEAEDIYVFRITVPDAATCKYCKKFYLDSDGTPAVYRLSTLLENGTNYGKKAADWKAVAGATHPNERCSGVLELKPGWQVESGGTLSYLGEDKWPEYIAKKVRN